MLNANTHRTSDSFNYNYDRHTPLVPYQNSPGQKPEMYYIKLNEEKRTHSREPTKPSLSPIFEDPDPPQIRPELYYITTKGNETENSNHHSFPASISEKRKSPIPHQPMYEEKPEIDSHQQPKLNGTITHPHQSQVTTYMKTTSNGDNQRTPSPSKRSNKKKHPTVDDNDKYDISNQQHHFPTALQDVSTDIRYVPLSKSKATESIQRSMNKYRFAGN